MFLFTKEYLPTSVLFTHICSIYQHLFCLPISVLFTNICSVYPYLFYLPTSVLFTHICSIYQHLFCLPISVLFTNICLPISVLFTNICSVYPYLFYLPTSVDDLYWLQDRASPYFALPFPTWVHSRFPIQWIGRRQRAEWSDCDLFCDVGPKEISTDKNKKRNKRDKCVCYVALRRVRATIVVVEKQ